MQDEREVGLVEPHPERARGDERLDAVLLEQALGLLALGRIGLPGVGAHLVAGLAQQPRGVLGRRDRQGVDDAASRQIADVAEQPGQAGRGIRQAQHAEAQRLPARAAPGS